jgi:prepilin-type N-terminal cleavage/methylation domain-containing protein
MNERRQDGYTLVEVMMALTVLAIGASGIFALQTVAVGGNAEASNLTSATNIGRGWIEIIKTQALAWNNFGPNPPSDLADAPLLNGLGPAWTALTLAGPPSPQRRDGAFSPDGLFCAQARSDVPVVGAGLPPINGREVTVRVWWFKGDFHNRAAFPNCGQAQAAVMGDDISRFHWVYLTTLITPHPQF